MGRILGRKAFDDYEEEDVPMFRRAVQGISPHTFANVFCDIMPHMGVGGFFGEATRDKLCFAGRSLALQRRLPRSRLTTVYRRLYSQPRHQLLEELLQHVLEG